MSRHKLKLSVLLLALLALQGACAKEQAPLETTPMREMTDDLGRKVKIPIKVNRAVSLAPNLTENIFAIGAGDKLVGVTTYCDYPVEAKQIQKIGDTISPNIESIIALKPQIVFVSTASQIQAFTQTLEKNDIQVFVTDPNSLEGITRNLRQMGEIFGTSGRAEELVKDMEARLVAIKEKTSATPPVKVFIQISREPLFTAGQDSFVTEMLGYAGGESVTRIVPTAYPRISKESALALEPEAIIVTAGAGNEEPNDVFKDSPAVKNKRILRVKADLLTRPSPRIVEGLEETAKLLHPDLFR